MPASNIVSPFSGTANKIVSSRNEEMYLPSVQKQRVLNKFSEVVTMQEPVVAGALNANFDSSKVTAAFVNEVNREH